MSECTLPSGRVVETHEPTFGEEIHIASTAGASIEELIYAKFGCILPGLSREEIEAMNREDGHALLREVSRIWDGRAEEAEVPFGNGSPPSSMDSNLASSIAKPASA